MTERKWTEKALSDANDRLARAAVEMKRSNDDLAQFAHAASHDLQEPLRMVSGFLKLLREQYAMQLDDKAREYVAYSVEGAMRISQLISDLLAYSQVERKGHELIPTDANQALAAALANLRGSIEESQAEVNCGQMPMVVADSMQLMQLFQNLIGNAVKFRSTERPCRVRIAVASESEQWTFSVRDNGIGIPPNATERIFVVF